MATDDLLIERLLRVIDEGRRTATYKLALLLGIIDTSATMPNETELPTRAIAERVLELYYPQTRSYVDRNGVTFMPRQISMKSSTVLAAVERLRVTGHAMRCRSIDEVARRAPRDYERALDVVEDTFVRYPIPLLQTVGTTPIPFLYAIDWAEGTSVLAQRTTRRSYQDVRRFFDHGRLVEQHTVVMETHPPAPPSAVLPAWWSKHATASSAESTSTSIRRRSPFWPPADVHRARPGSIESNRCHTSGGYERNRRSESNFHRPRAPIASTGFA
ncbi:MAG: hypothetical protein KDB40_02455 [Acidimicrobiales bacterium]|nr:hypothetical protein [Acidimicrobiales bacterium]MCB9393279.1 hypothetical protein [Acidimicrobiaceae bacterium]